jgi:T5SS/PEP-CTERM-associated repeat protein
VPEAGNTALGLTPVLALCAAVVRRRKSAANPATPAVANTRALTGSRGNLRWRLVPLGLLASALTSPAQQVVDGVAVTSPTIITVATVPNATGTLVIKNGGSVSGPDAAVGLASGASGDVSVAGMGSSLTSANRLALGLGASLVGSLEVTGGGLVVDANGLLGSDSNGTAAVAGAGSNWVNSASLIVGNFGSGSLNVSNSGATSGGNLVVGQNQGSTGTVNVSGAGTVSGTSIMVGQNHGSTGAVTVAGAGSILTYDDPLIVGSDGNGSLAITAGGVVQNSNNTNPNRAVIGELGGTGTVSVDGQNSALSANVLYVGENGHGTLDVSGQATVASDYGIIGTNLQGAGTVKVKDGASWTNLGFVTVADQGKGSLAISNQGSVVSAYGSVGNSIGSHGDVTVTGSGSSLTMTIDSPFLPFAVGNSGEGALSVTDNGSVNVGVMTVAAQAGSAGSVTVDGGTLNATAININEHGTLNYVRTGSAVGALTAGTIDNAGTFNIDTRASNHAPADQRTVAGALTNEGNGIVDVWVDRDATVIFNDPIQNLGSFEVSAKPGVTSLQAKAQFLGTFTNMTGANYLQDPLFTEFDTLINHGDFTATAGNIITVDNGLFNDGNFSLTGSHLASLAGLENDGQFNIFDGGSIRGMYAGTGDLVFHVGGLNDTLSFSDFFTGRLDIVFDNGLSADDQDWFITFAQGADLTGLTIGGVDFQQQEIDPGYLSGYTEFQPVSPVSSVPDGGSTALCLAPIVVLCVAVARRPRANRDGIRVSAWSAGRLRSGSCT